MVYSGPCKYRGSNGNVSVNSDGLHFTRIDGLISQRQVVVIKIPIQAINNISIEGGLKKKVVVLVDGKFVPGIPRHEFETSDVSNLMSAINFEMMSKSSNQNQMQSFTQQPQTIQYKETVREIVKIYCAYCGSLNEMKNSYCEKCGAPLGKQ